jgi:hypothetical protein
MGAMEQVVLQEDAMDRALVALHEFVSLFLSKGGNISDFYAIGTSIYVERLMLGFLFNG